MAPAPAREIVLYGTDEAVTPPRELVAGPLRVLLDAGQLRTIRMGDAEAIRGIAFLVRNENWGTYPARISGLEVTSSEEAFVVTYEAACGPPGASVRYQARIEGRADGHLRFEATATPEVDFATNRTGFVVLHPLRGVAGRPARLEHTDGRIEEARFPEVISPIQPFFDLRAISHEVQPGLQVRCLMERDAFETEDQRNWGDASFKTYVRPLALPKPYVLEAGVSLSQSVTLSFSGPLPGTEARAQAAPIEIVLGAAAGRMPRLGLGVTAEETLGPLLRALRPGILLGAYEAGQDPEALQGMAALASDVGAELALEVLLPGAAPAAEELAAVKRALDEAQVRPAAIAFSPAADLVSVSPGTRVPGVPTWEEIFTAARAALPQMRIGGGTFAYFTELNRKRPPQGLLDFVTHTTSAIVHAADDTSVMETLETLAAMARSTRAFAPGVPYRLGPIAIGMRQNPYGAAPAETNGAARVPMARIDPRQRGLFGAAYICGYAAHAARAGVEAVTFGAPTGPFGVISTPQAHTRPWFDDVADARVYPAFHVLRWLAEGQGRQRCEVTVSDESSVQAVAFQSPGRVVLLMANLGPHAREVRVRGGGDASLTPLDASTFVEATCAPLTWQAARAISLDDVVRLEAYAVVRLEIADPHVQP